MKCIWVLIWLKFAKKQVSKQNGAWFFIFLVLKSETNSWIFLFIVCVFVCVINWIEPRTYCMLGKFSTTEL